MKPRKWKIIVFTNGSRKEKWVNGDPERFVDIVKEMNEQEGVKAHLASRVYAYRPRVSGEPGQLWCPYCRRWRWFTEMKQYLDERVPFWATVCKWCRVSVEDYYVRKFNHLFLTSGSSKRRRRRRERNRS